MLEIVLAESKDSILEFALEDNWANSIEEVNHLLCNLIQMERCDISLAIPNEESFEVDQLLIKPHVTGALDDDAMYLNSESLENCLNVGGTLCSTGHYDQRDLGILDANAEQVRRQALKYEFMLEEPEENEILHFTCNLSCDCSDYLLENSLDYPSISESTVINMEYASQIQCMGGSVDEVEPDYITRAFSMATLDPAKVQSHDALDSALCQNASSEAPKWLKHELLFDEQNLTGLGSVSDLMESQFLSEENGVDDMILFSGNEMPESVFSCSPASLPHAGALVSGAAKNELPYGDGRAAAVSQGAHEISRTTNDSVMTAKRLRKPTRRYIEETSEIKPSCSYDRLRKYYLSGAVQLLYQEHSLRGCRRKSTKLLGKDSKGCILPSESAKILSFQESEQQDDESDESSVRIPKRRKHHRQWTLSEVIKLVDGVSQHGVGRWTVIKRLFFSTSAYRTAVDLKDKWRNLLRASVVDPAHGNLVEPHKKQALAPIPQPILQRVRDISIIHPYPRSQKS